MVYYIPLFILAILGIFEVLNTNAKFGRGAVILVGVFFILFAGFRNIGPDFAEYKRYFELSDDVSELLNQGVEPIYAYLNHFVKTNDWSFQIVLFFIAILAVAPKMYFIQKYSLYIFPALVVYLSSVFLIKEMGQIRHGVAMAFALVAFGMMYEERTKAALFFIFCALLFHYSAICILPAFFLVKRQISSVKMLVIAFTLLPLVMIDIKPIVATFIGIFPIEGINGKLRLYLNSPEYGVSVGLNSSIALRLIVLGIMLYFRDTLTEKQAGFNLFLNLYFLGVCYYFIFGSISVMAMRTSVYFRVLEIIILPCFILLGKTVGEKLLITLLISANSAFTLYKYLNLDGVLGEPMFDGYENQLKVWFIDMLHVIN